MKITRTSASVLALLMTAALVPAGHAIEPIPMTPLAEFSLGFAYTQDFDAGPGDWTASPVPPYARPDPVSSWEWGAPTSGPGAAFSGNNVWATNLSGTYGATECGAILSPPIDLTEATEASVAFMQWRHMDQTTSGSRFVNDAGRFFVTQDGGATLAVVDPDQGNDGPMTSTTSVRVCFDNSPTGTQAIGGPPGATVPPPVYSLMSADLSAYTGQVVQFAIAFTSTSSTHRAGWYVDDFTVTIDGTPAVEDFESGPGGFTVIGTADATPAPSGWAWGEAGAGPAATSPLWATNPEDNYGHRECGWTESPAFLLGDAPNAAAGTVTARLTYDQWFRSNSLYAAGIVQVGVHDGTGVAYHYVEPDGGYPGSATGTYADQLQGCLGEEAGEGAFSGTHDTNGAALEAVTVDLTQFVGQTVSLRFFFASAWSPANPALHAGWYVDDVEVELRAVVMGPDAEQIADDVAEAAANPQFPGWSTGGTDSTWAYGVASEVGPEGDVVYATNLAGNHARECSWIESPAIPGSLLAGNALTFTHWFHQYASSSSGTAWNGGALMVSTDDGATWTYVDLPQYTAPGTFSGLRDCIRSVDPTAPNSPRVFSGVQEFYTTVSADLSAYSGAANVKVRFLEGTGIATARPGWYIDSVSVGGLTLVA